MTVSETIKYPSVYLKLVRRRVEGLQWIPSFYRFIEIWRVNCNKLLFDIRNVTKKIKEKESTEKESFHLEHGIKCPCGKEPI
jgi:hypothetical protein